MSSAAGECIGGWWEGAYRLGLSKKPRAAVRTQEYTMTSPVVGRWVDGWTGRVDGRFDDEKIHG